MKWTLITNDASSWPYDGQLVVVAWINHAYGEHIAGIITARHSEFEKKGFNWPFFHGVGISTGMWWTPITSPVTF